LQNWNRDC